jgi:OOP family OmpA-OmpF porin
LLTAADLTPARSKPLAAYLALDPALALRRFETILEPPPTVSFVLEDGKVHAHGSAPHHWIEQARALVRTLPPGSPRWTCPRSTTQMLELRTRPRRPGSRHLLRPQRPETRGRSGREMAPGERSPRARGAPRQMRVIARVTVAGHADSTGKDTANRSETWAAQVVRSMLRARGVDPDLLSVRGAGPLEPLKDGATEEDRSINRRVSFTVGIVE